MVKSSRRHVLEANDSITGKNYRTALICVTAGGFILSPLFLLSAENLTDSWCVDGPPNAHYSVTAKARLIRNNYSFLFDILTKN